jgi:hypothetical protein
LKDKIENHSNFYKKTKKKIEIQIMKVKLENIIFDKLRLEDDIENK